MKPIRSSHIAAGSTALLLLALVACGPSKPEPVDTGVPDPDRGHTNMIRYGCSACHVIPGVPGRATKIGPAMAGFAGRETIAGSLPNTDENVIRWIRNPKSINPRTGMPNMGLSEIEARDVAAYLRTLK